VIEFKDTKPPEVLVMPQMELLQQVIEMNQMIVKQNSLIVQMLSVPQLIVKGKE
jgi:hypothetical protein